MLVKRQLANDVEHLIRSLQSQGTEQFDSKNLTKVLKDAAIDLFDILHFDVKNNFNLKSK
ncbi:uncharacterized protein PHALS_15287 [Plasmopara halstedii]|uniref:Uncharacterized protein n=1 Tax=Plasmopara halstedii TaxID=4781 RepID=A0A0P1ACN4_PLAHL|nr:uncharacterized protein PHALS_15287 [Plasmopara halstedii]CEG38113.1 hypothetical protein PHALS_15287 [Plasmopara halstedii]|eukprot:XP_024574482.1 hypothetical protein PHALS_15287 [Plasmopara halstedii]